MQIREAMPEDAPPPPQRREAAFDAALTAHQIKTPILSMMARLEAPQPPAPGALRAELAVLLDRIDAVAVAARGELCAAAAEGGERVPLAALVRRVCLGLGPIALSRGQWITMRDMTGGRCVAGDAGALGEAIGCVVENALHHGPADARVDVVTTAGCRVYVLDRGPGVAPEALPRLVAPFAQAAPGTGGSGLGLALADGVARAGGGALSVRLRPRGGSAFTLRFA